MDFYVSRAMHIAGMDIGQINTLHELERRRNYCVMNRDIQTLFNLPTIKERWTIPEEGLEVHAQRIRNVLLSQQIAQSDTFKAVDENGQEITVVLKPWESLTTGRVDAVHAFDASVYDALAEGKISFAYEGAVASGTRLRDRVGAGRRKADVFND